MAQIPPPDQGKCPIFGVVRNKTLHSAAAATADGAILDITGMSTVALTLSTTGFSGTVLFKVSQDGTNYKTIRARKAETLHEATGTGSLTTETAVTVWRADVSGYSYFKAPITRTAGSITVTADASIVALPAEIEGELTIKTVAAQAITAGTPLDVWTPTTGTRFRLQGFAFSVSAAAYLIVKDNTTVILNSPLLAIAGVYTSPDFGKGRRSSAIDAVLKLDVSANATVTGYVWGREEAA